MWLWHSSHAVIIKKKKTRQQQLIVGHVAQSNAGAKLLSLLGTEVFKTQSWHMKSLLSWACEHCFHPHTYSFLAGALRLQEALWGRASLTVLWFGAKLEHVWCHRGQRKNFLTKPHALPLTTRTKPDSTDCSFHSWSAKHTMKCPHLLLHVSPSSTEHRPESLPP